MVDRPPVTPLPSLPTGHGEDIVLRPVARTVMTRPARVAVGGSARAGAAALQLSRTFGVAASRRPGAVTNPTSLPWGVWPHRPATAPSVELLGSALASYARLLEAKRGPRREPPVRGLPLLARRRGGTAAGAMRGPGGLAHGAKPTIRTVPPLEQRLLERTRTPSEGRGV